MDVDMLDEELRKKLAEQLRPDKTALIIVDVQNDFCHDQGVFGKSDFNLSHVEKAINKLLPFLNQCQQYNLPIIFVRTVHSHWTDSESWIARLQGAAREMPICRPDSWGAEFYKVKPLTTDFIVTKHRFSGFVGTNLDLVLRSKRIETLLMTGVATNVCVETTARDGFNRDYRIVLVEDCCAAFSPEEHASTITNINKYFGIVTDSKVLAEILGEHVSPK
jgi:ureidoacrylate peracid hydrolase